MALLGLIPGNLMGCQKKILKIKLSQTAFLHQLLPDHHLLTDINFNGHCFIKK